jgi:F-box-like
VITIPLNQARNLIHQLTDLAVRSRFQNWLARKRHPGFAFDVSPPEEGSLLINPVYQQGELDQYGVHPISNLPPELLGEIFAHCLPPRIWQPPLPNVHEAPMLLCQVCSYWRELALSLPMLWSSFYGSTGHGSGRLSSIRLWIERSRTHPLFISVDLCQENPLTSSMMHLFLDNIHRWDDVAFCVGDKSAKDVLAIPGGSAHLLDSFGINAAECNTKTIDEISSIFLSFPNLRRLRWYSKSTPMALLGMTFSRLMHIKLLCNVPFNECICFIAQCSQIRDIEITHIEPSPVPLTLPIITLPHLSSLCVPVGISEFLDYFTLPSLRILGFGMLKLRNFENLAARSSFKLDTLHVSDSYNLTGEEVICYLRMPCLELLRELSIRASRLTDQTVSLLQWSEANNILPHLEILSIRRCDTTDGVFSDMVASRWRPNGVCQNNESPTSLKLIGGSFEGGFEKKQRVIDYSRMQEFEVNGLETDLY